MFILAHHATNLTLQHVFQSPKHYLCEEDETQVFVTETRVEVLFRWFGVWEYRFPYLDILSTKYLEKTSVWEYTFPYLDIHSTKYLQKTSLTLVKEFTDLPPTHNSGTFRDAYLIIPVKHISRCLPL